MPVPPSLLEVVLFSIDPPLSAEENMQRDEENFSAAQSFSKSQFLLRIYEWKHPAISLGRAQHKSFLLNRRLEQQNIAVVRRLSGGRAVLHHREITYSLAAPFDSPYWGGTLLETYQKIARCLLHFLQALFPSGVYEFGAKPQATSPLTAKAATKKAATKTSPVCFDCAGFGEIEAFAAAAPSVSLGKLVGSAQRRGKSAFLQHGSLPLFRHPLRLEDFVVPADRPARPVTYVFLEELLRPSENNVSAPLSKKQQAVLGASLKKKMAQSFLAAAR